MLLMFSLYSLLKHRDPKGKQAAVFLFMILSSLKCCPQLEGTRKKKKEKAISSGTWSCGIPVGALVAVTRLMSPSPSWSTRDVLDPSLPRQPRLEPWSAVIGRDYLRHLPFPFLQEQSWPSPLIRQDLETPNHLEQIHFKENGFKAAPVLVVLGRKLRPVQHSSVRHSPDSLVLSFLRKEKQEKPLCPLPRLFNHVLLFSGASSLRLEQLSCTFYVFKAD